MAFMKLMAGVTALGALLLGSSLIPSPAQAGYVVTLQEVGSDVIATGSGPIDLTDLRLVGGVGIPKSFIDPQGAIFIGPVTDGPPDEPLVRLYSGLVGSGNFGKGFLFENTIATTGGGDAVGIDVGGTVDGPLSLGVPLSYVSNSPLSDTSIYLNQNFATLGIIPGIYFWTWGTGPNQNFTLIIGAAAVPEPASAALLGMALAGLLLVRARRRSLDAG